MRKHMEINIDSSLDILPNDLLMTKISWLAHDLDKTINADIETSSFKKIASNEAKRLKDALEEWKRRHLSDDALISWAKNVYGEYETIVNEGKEIYNLEFDYNELDSEAVLYAIKTRRSIRRWKNKPVPKELVRKVIEAAQWAPSACNRQSTRYIVLEDESQKQLLVNLREKWLGNAPVLIFIGADKRNYLPEEIDYVPYMDASMAAQNLLLSAHALGLGAVICKTAGWDINVGRSKEYTKAISNMYSGLNIPTYFIPVSIIALGYSARYPKEPQRMPFDQVVFYDQYKTDNENIISFGNHKSAKYMIRHLMIKVIIKIAQRFGIRAYLTF